MIGTLIGIKKEMSVRFDQLGRRLPVTVIAAEPNVVLLKQRDKIQLGSGKKKKVKKTENFYINALGFMPRIIKDVACDPGTFKNGDRVTVDIFEPGDKVRVTGTTRGKGFAGGVKRWGFAGGPKTHGQSDRHRAPGSIGQTTTPGRVYRGKKMAGHMGVDKLTVGGLEVVEVDSAHNLLVVKGAVPGAKNGLVVIEKTGKVKKPAILLSQSVGQAVDTMETESTEKSATTFGKTEEEIKGTKGIEGTEGVEDIKENQSPAFASSWAKATDDKKASVGKQSEESESKEVTKREEKNAES